MNGNIVTVELTGAVRQNEIAQIPHGAARLQGEIVRIRGGLADLQIFETTNGIKVGDPVEFTDELLSVELGPGLLGQLYDGLQNPLHRLADEFGYFLPLGTPRRALDSGRKWTFHPLIESGTTVIAGEALGYVEEGPIRHKILAPFWLTEPQLLEEIVSKGEFRLDDRLGTIRDLSGNSQALTFSFDWPVRKAIRSYEERLAPTEPLITQIRIIDSMFPIAKGGTYCIPGPFGAGKTVLQQITGRFAEVDVVIIVACGERAGEVVDTIRDFPRLSDPRTGRSLMERTIIICNTSSMPVAAREASVYTGITLAEYYRQMGLDVLLLADSTSRWAQAMRERSGRLEEIPGEEAFPAYLQSTIAAFYERAGRVRLKDGTIGSVTIGGTVSPAGGNFEEPVTQATLKVVGAFHALSQDRADARRYPAVDPLESWSRYEGIVERPRTQSMRRLLNQAHEIDQMMKVVGEEGTSPTDFAIYLKGLFFDDVFLQQNAFDPVDAATPAERQRRLFDLLELTLAAELNLPTRDGARRFFQELRQLFLDLNSLPADSESYDSHFQLIRDRIEETRVRARQQQSPGKRSALVESDLDADIRRPRRLRPGGAEELLLNSDDETNDQ